jgi:hypothetical protein
MVVFATEYSISMHAAAQSDHVGDHHAPQQRRNAQRVRMASGPKRSLCEPLCRVLTAGRMILLVVDVAIKF